MGVRRGGLLSQPALKLLAQRRGRKKAKAQAAALTANRSRFEAQQGDRDRAVISQGGMADCGAGGVRKKRVRDIEAVQAAEN
jgi:hypothetical protein